MKFLIASVLLVLSLFMFSAEDNSIVYLRFSDADSLDPGKSRIQYSGEVTSNIFEGLVRYRKDSPDIEPCLAEKWESSPDGKVWMFTLRRGIFFHNGSELDASSVVYSFQTRMKHSHEYPKWKLFFPFMKNVKAMGKYRVRIELSHPFAPFLKALSDPVAFIIYRGSGDGPHFQPIGTGPFKFQGWIRGQQIVLENHSRYWEHPVQISKVTFKVIPNPVWRIEQLKKGNADVLSIRSANEYNQFLGIRNIVIAVTASNGTFFLAFNTEKKPFDQVLVRRAFGHLIDKQVMIRQIFQQFATPATTPLPPQIIGHHNGIDHYTFNIEEAKKLLRQAGYANGFTCSLYFLEGDVGEQKIADYFVRHAKQVGINIKRKPYPFPELLKKIRKKEPDMSIRGWVAGPDPDIFLYANFTMGPGNANWAYYDNPQLIAILRQARQELNSNRRIALYRTAQEIIYREVPWIPLYHLNYLIVHTKEIKNLYFNSNSFIIFKDCYKSAL